MAQEEETGSLIPQEEADGILSEIRSCAKYKKYKLTGGRKNKYETSWLSPRTLFGKKLHEARDRENILKISYFTKFSFENYFYPNKEWRNSIFMMKRAKKNFTKRPKQLK